MRPAHPTRRDPAVKEAREVVGLYGDPDTSWGIAIDLGVSRLEPGPVAERLAVLCAAHSHLGAAPEVELVGEGAWPARRAALAAAGYGTASLLRVAVRDDGRRLAVGAHHGAIDGLGLVAVAAAALGEPLRTRAQGIGDRPARSGFVRSSISRLGEALVDPPPRFAGLGEDSPLEDLSELTRPLLGRGTAHLAAAAAGVFGSRGHEGLPLLVIGASRRVGTLPEPDRQTAYLRLRVRADAEPDHVRRALATVDPEPDFPATSARGIGPRITHLMRHRLGATALLSNLGLFDGPVDSIAMFPACSGPRAVAVGLSSTTAATTLALRTRRSDFTADEHASLLSDLGERFFA